MSVPSVLRENIDRLDDVEESELVAFARERLTEAGADDARVTCDAMWCQVWPASAAPPKQGWKLHLSATPESAREVLARALPALLAAGCAFKFAATPDRVAMLNGPLYARSGAGKFLTIYPEGDEQFVRLARELHEATVGLTGPRILSDRLYRADGADRADAADGIVHYRYGGFADIALLNNESEYVPALVDPNGDVVPDRREAWFAPPPWAVDPLAGPDGATNAASQTQGKTAGGQVLLGDRFAAREALRQSNRGGVYRATDTETGATAIVKQARRYVAGNDGEDAQLGLRHEARVLGDLAGLAAAPLALFEQGGDVFLAEEEVPGVSLRNWARERARVVGAATPDHPGVPLPAFTAMMTRLTNLLEAVHARGWVLRDLTPPNVMVSEADEVKLIDLEFAARPGERKPSAGTLGYVAPEQVAREPTDFPADHYSLGAIAFFLATGIDPVFPKDEPDDRGQQERMRGWLRMLYAQSPTARAAEPMILGLTDAEPGRRWSPKQVKVHLERGAPARRTARAATADVDWLLDDGLDYLCETFAPESSRPWPVTCVAERTDATNVQHGTAGVIAVLARAARHHPRDGLTEVLRAASDWTVSRADRNRLLPGLYYGRSGTAWALREAAEALGDAELARHAAELALAVPVEWPNPDVTHGAAGAALTQLRFWRATGDAAFGDRLVAGAQAVARCAAQTEAGELVWPIPRSFDSGLAGLTHFGFAHGTAGIGYVLLAASRATGRSDWLELAVRAGDGLVSAALDTDGAAVWPAGPADRSSGSDHWCSGSSGVGTFLIQLWATSGQEKFRDYAELAAAAVARRRWYSTAVACHGLAGDAEFLLDMAELTGEPRYTERVHAMTELVCAKHTLRGGKMLVPDESNHGFAIDYATGVSGVLGFLLRLRHQLPRLWMVDATWEVDEYNSDAIAEASSLLKGGTG